jgi:hypothetical protein
LAANERAIQKKISTTTKVNGKTITSSTDALPMRFGFLEFSLGWNIIAFLLELVCEDNSFFKSVIAR